MSEPPCIIDLRPQATFEGLHPQGAWHLEPEEIPEWPFALPPRDRPVFVLTDKLERAGPAAAVLRARGWKDIRLLSPDPATWPARPESGPERPAVWPAPWLVQTEDLLPSSGTALDIGAGTGRNAVWLALRGLTVTAADLLPDALERAERLARRVGVSLELQAADLRKPGERPRASFDVVCAFRYLDRGLFPWIREAVKPGGLVIFETFVGEPRGIDGPRRRIHRLRPGELGAAFEGFEVLRSREADSAEPELASIVARRPR